MQFSDRAAGPICYAHPSIGDAFLFTHTGDAGSRETDHEGGAFRGAKR
jgi:hypothetical protein